MAKIDTPLGPMQLDRVFWQSDPVHVPALGVRMSVLVEPGGSDPDGPPDAALLAAVLRFLAVPRSRRDEVEPHLWAYYREICARIEEDNDPDFLVPISGPKEAWDHVRFKSLSPERDETSGFYVSVAGNCDWEEEHGVQIVWWEDRRDGRWRLVKVSSWDGHLTDGRAWNIPGLDDWMADSMARLPFRTVSDFLKAKRRLGF